MQNKNISTPWATFCIATYKRQKFLRSALSAIDKQRFRDFEVVVSDNDPEGSAADLISEFPNINIRYHKNKMNLGMVKNFNQALSMARGKYVVMITDDDPPNDNMLETLHQLEQANPGYGAYFGACEVNFVSEILAKLYQVKPGINPQLANTDADAIRIFTADEFPRRFLQGNVFPYVLWSTGIVRRDIAKSIGGMPDYGTPYLTDFAYITLAGAQAGFVTINKVLGSQTVHEDNFGRFQYFQLPKAASGLYKILSSQLCHRPDWPCISSHAKVFLQIWLLGHLSFLINFFKARKNLLHQFEIRFLMIFFSVRFFPSINSLKFLAKSIRA